MLPPGHIAAGFLTAKVVLKIVPYTFSASEQASLTLWGMFWGFAPDLDFFYAFFVSKRFQTKPGINHRKYYAHAPVLWLIAGLLVYFFARTDYMKVFGLLVWLGSWSHFVLDTIQDGIMWFWPASPKFVQLAPVIDLEVVDKHMSAVYGGGFLRYWTTFLKEYAHGLKVSLTCEIILLIITAALIVGHRI